MLEPDLTTFQRKLAERRAAREAEKNQTLKDQVDAAEFEFDSDLIPEVEYERSEQDHEMDKVIQSIDIIEAYRRWCKKMVPEVRAGQIEGIKISCPIPGHADKNPSAWINLDKQIWFCGACNTGGDAHDIAAYHFGYPVPGYKDGAQFHKLRQEMAKDFGFSFTVMPGGITVVTAPVLSPEPTSGEKEPKAEVIALYEEDDDDILPQLDWKPLVLKDTFLDEYMKATCIDDAPEEYHFFHGLLAVGMAIGMDVRLRDQIPVCGNFFICTLGHTGAGKSKALRHLTSLLKGALPHEWKSATSKGTRHVGAPASAEVLIHNFEKQVPDPTDLKKIAYYAPVRGLINFNELSSLTGRAGRAGSVLAPTLMQFYDNDDLIMTSSMTHGSKEAHNAFGSCITTTQPRALKDLITRTDLTSGFLNRWLFIPGREKKKYAVGGVDVDMRPAYKPLQSIQGWASSFAANERMDWSPEAEKKFTIFFYEHIVPDKKKNKSELLVRIDLTMKKLILLFTANRMLKIVPVEAVDEAILCYPYLLEGYAIPEAKLGDTLSSEISEAIMLLTQRSMKKSKTGLTLNNIAVSLRRKKYPNELILKACDSLVKLGFLELETTQKGSVGRPTVRYKYVS